MSKALGMRCVWGLCGVLAGAMISASVARAEVSTDLSGSVLVYPKVVWTGNVDNARDTVIQLSNTSNNLVHVHCFYVNAAPVNPDFPAGPLNPRQWQVTDFRLWLTRQQPTHWVASQGRQVNPNDGFNADGSGIDPGAIPPVPPGFEGELKCVQVDSGGVPFGGNNLKGEAVIRRNDGDVNKYNAIAILADPDRASGEPANELALNSTPTEDGEYNACPNTLLVDHFLDGSPNPAVQGLNPAVCNDTCDAGTCTLSNISCSTDDDCAGSTFCPVRTELTLVPCSEDFENAVPSRVTVQFTITNELEQTFSASTTVDCWLNTRLADITSSTGTCSGALGGICSRDEDCINANNGFCEKLSPFSLGNLGTGTAFTRLTPVDLDGGVIGIAEEITYNGDPASATATWNLQQEGNRYDATLGIEGGPVTDTIVIPAGF